jgi:branched-chain amino acid transport system substrate-binding protein
MNRLLFLRGLTLAAGASLVAVACGGSAGTNTGGSSSDCSKGEIVIASDLPVSGADASSGVPAQNGAQFAVQSAKCVKGFKLTFQPFDDAVNGVHDAQKGAQNVQQMISNNKVLGMVGPFNSGVAQAEIPVANQAALAMVSPSNTNECLTQDQPYCQQADGFTPKSLRPTGKNNYYRVAAADTFQGPGMADFAFDTLKLTKVAAFSDNETFGKGVKTNFVNEFKKKGGTVVVDQDFDMKSTTDFKSFLNDSKSKGAQAIYAGATSATKGCIPLAQANGIFDKTTFYYLGPDGIGDSQCIKDAGSMASDHMYASQGAADATQNASAADTINKYKAAFPKKEDVGAYTFAAYDCAAILVDAVGRAIDSANGKMPTRQQVVDAVAKTKDFKGLTGTISFNAQGDPTAPVLQIQQYKGGDWAFFKQFNVGG